MSCEHLVCANCAGRVVDGGCPVCRAARAHTHGQSPFAFTPELALLLAAVIAVLVVFGLA